MKVAATEFEGVKIILPDVYEDNRGFFSESFNQEKLLELGIRDQFVQDNHSYSKSAGVIRGLHYQIYPKAQSKLVRVICGAIYDIVVDLRQSSPTFGKWFGTILSSENQRQLLIPKGFAHGFCTLVDHTHVMYKVDNYYSPEYERGILWNDKKLNIDWTVRTPILSDKDKQNPSFDNAEINF